MINYVIIRNGKLQHNFNKEAAKYQHYYQVNLKNRDLLQVNKY